MISQPCGVRMGGVPAPILGYAEEGMQQHRAAGDDIIRRHKEIERQRGEECPGRHHRVVAQDGAASPHHTLPDEKTR